MKEFPLLFKLFLFAGSSFIGSVKLVTAPSQNLRVATPGPGRSHNVGLGCPLTPDANACVTKENPKPCVRVRVFSNDPSNEDVKLHAV